MEHFVILSFFHYCFLILFADVVRGQAVECRIEREVLAKCKYVLT